MTKLAAVFPDRIGGYWGAEAGRSDVDARAIRNGDVGTAGTVRWSALPLRGYTHAEIAKARVRAGDIVLTTSGNCGNVAYIGEEPAEVTVATNFVRILRADAERVDPRYAFHYLRSGWFSRDIIPFVRGATIKNLSVEAAFQAIQIPVPPIGEQRRIAAILDQADAIRTKRRQLLAHLNALTQSIYHAMFGSGDFVAPIVRLGDQLDFLTSGSRGWAKYYSPDGAAFIRIQNVGHGRLDESDLAFVDAPDNAEARRTRVQDGDVLLSITADLGRTAVVPRGLGRAHINQHLAILRSSSIEPVYLSAFLESSQGRRELMKKNRGQTKDGLNFDDIRSVEMPMPTRELQRAFAERVESVDDRRGPVKRALAADDELFASLQSRAFRGEL